MSEFRAVLEEARGGGALIGVPVEVVEDLGGAGRIKVVATFDGIEYRGSVVTSGAGRSSGCSRRSGPSWGNGPATSSP